MLIEFRSHYPAQFNSSFILFLVESWQNCWKYIELQIFFIYLQKNGKLIGKTGKRPLSIVKAVYFFIFLNWLKELATPSVGQVNMVIIRKIPK